MNSSEGSSPLRILLVEDSQDDAQLIKLQLEAEGLIGEFQCVQTEKDFTTALDSVPDLILSDYALPQFNGMHALKIVKDQGLNIPFILISGTVGEDFAVGAIKQGADDYMMKDRMARLGTAIRHALENKHLRDEKRAADKALRDSEERYRSIFENANMAIWEEDFTEVMAALDDLRDQGITDFRCYLDEHPEFLQSALQQIKIIEANQSMLKLYGAAQKSDMLISLDKLITPEILKEELLALAEGRSYYEKETVNRGLHGNEIALLMKISYFKSVDGRCKGLIYATDITHRKQTEYELRRAEMKYRTLAEQVPPIIYITNLDQAIGVSYISPRIELLGFTAEEWVADPELWLRQIHPDDQQGVLAIIENSKAKDIPFRAEYRIRTRDGSIRWFLDEVVDILDDSGAPTFRQGYMLDITARKEAEEELRDQNVYLGLLNQMTHIILLASDYDATLRALAYDVKKIINADDCHIIQWDEVKQQPILVTSTADPEVPLSDGEIGQQSLELIQSVIQAGHTKVVDNVYQLPHGRAEAAANFPARSMIVLPLTTGQHKLGAVILAFNSLHQFTQSELDRAETASNQIALALWEFRQDIEIQHSLKESTALARIGRALSETESVGTDEVLQLIVDSALALIEQAEESVIHLVNIEEQTLVPRAISGFDANTKVSEKPHMRLGEGVAGLVIHSGETINVGNIHSSQLFLMQDVRPKFQSLLVAPVQSGNKQIGTISVQSNELHAFSDHDAELLKALGTQAAIAIENSNLFEGTQQHLREVNALYRISQGLASTLDTDQLISDVVTLLQQNFGYYYVQIYLQDLVSGDLFLKSGSGEIGVQLVTQQYRVSQGLGIIGHVAATAEPFVTNDVHNVMFYVSNPLLPDTQSELTVPIKVGGEVEGVLDIHHTEGNRLTANDLQLMTAVADQLSVALQKASLYNNLQTALQQEQTVRSQLIQSERLALVGQLLASVSHELNNPLQAIQNALFLLKDEEHLSAQGRQDLDVILSEAERMAALIERLRSAYRPTRIMDFQAVEINNLIEDVHMLINTHMRHKEIIFEFHPDTRITAVAALPDQIRQVVLNLFLNAIEAMKPGGRLTVETRRLLQQNEILITVKDTGLGIAPDILPKIFDAFTTDKHTGTGLGLTITHDIIVQHHGRISAENNPDGGATFMVWLPIDQRGLE